MPTKSRMACQMARGAQQPWPGFSDASIRPRISWEKDLLRFVNRACLWLKFNIDCIALRRAYIRPNVVPHRDDEKTWRPVMAELDDIKKDPKKMAALLAFTKRSLCLENILFYFDKGNPEAIYPKYIADSAKTQVNLDAKFFNVFKQLADAGKWKEMAPVIVKAKAAIHAMVVKDTLPKFLKSKEFAEYQIAATPAKPGMAKKAAKLLGLDEKKLAEIFQLRELKKTKEADKLLDALAKKEKLDLKSKAVMQNLKECGLL
jgi:hypothetical protein